MEDYVYKLPRPQIMERAFLKFTGKASSSMFTSLITAYSKIELSFQNNILNAFAGLAEMVKNDCGVEVCYCLVSTAISHSLLWKLSTPLTLRQTGFPSWSWCGWLGPIIMQACWEDLSIWTIKYTWIHWYLYGGNNQFTLVPQKQWHAPRTHDDPDTSTAPAEGIDDSPMNFMSRLTKDFKPNKFTPSMAGFDTLRGNEDLSPPAPQYLELPSKYGPDRGTTAPSSILTVEDIGIKPGTSLENHTLYFRALSTTVYMSPYDPRGHGSLGTSQYVYLYDLQDQYLGAAEITHADALRSFNVRRNST